MTTVTIPLGTLSVPLGSVSFDVPDAPIGGGAGLTNTRLSKTAAYTIVNADKGKTMALGGSAFYAVTLGPVAGFDADFSIKILNEDDTRGKRVTADGMSSFILWPGQSREVFRSDAKWFASPIQRWTITAPVVFYVDTVNGADANDGLASGSGAVNTIERAYHHIRDCLELQYIGIPTIQLTAGQTITEQIKVYGPLVGNLQFIIQGSTSPTPGDWANYPWIVPAGGVGIQARDLGIVTVRGIKMSAAGASSFGITFSQFGVVDWEMIDFGYFPNGYHIYGFQKGSGNRLAGGCQISGSAKSHMRVEPDSMITTQGGANIPAPLNFADGFMNINGGIINQGPSIYTGAGNNANTYACQAVISDAGKGYNMTCNPGHVGPLLINGGQSL